MATCTGVQFICGQEGVVHISHIAFHGKRTKRIDQCHVSSETDIQKQNARENKQHVEHV